MHAISRPRDDDEPLNARDLRDWLQAARQGHFAAAWAASDRIRARSRPGVQADVPRHFQRIWDGTPVDGRRVLVRCYHGLGDTIQFARYLPWLRARARAVTVWAQPALLPLLRTLDAPLAFAPLHDGTPDVETDVYVEIMELPYLFRSTLATIPRDVPYLHAPAAHLPTGRRRIGLVWRAGDWDPRRSIQFDEVAALLDAMSISTSDECIWYDLQADRRPGETHPILRRANTSTVAHTAACIAALDLVISVDSMPAHLAGALGRPVWTLLQHEADWRWLIDRADSPWYPTMRLFRQSKPGHWRGVLEEVRAALLARGA